MDSAKRVISGTFGKIWLNGVEVGECFGFQAKWVLNKEEVPMPGKMVVDHKVKNVEGTGVVKYYKTNSRFAIMVGEEIKQGRDPRFIIISELKDPDAYGAERVSVSNVSFDDLVIADWETGVFTKHDAPFTFTDYEYLDLIGVQ